MLKKDCFYLGRFVKPRGLKGELKMVLDTDQPERYAGLDAIFVSVDGGDALVPFFIERMSIEPKGAVLKLEGIDSQQAADAHVGMEVFLPDSALPKLEGNQFYFHEVIGYAVEDATHGNIGSISAIHDAGPQALMVVKEGPREIMIPITDDFIVSLDRDKKVMYVRTPEGLVELY